jgi:alkylation response protein AidB-like acyl-CoA dehydrogenase
MLLARTNPQAPKHQGLTYFVLDLHQPGVEVRPLRQITGEAEFNEVFLDGARVPDADRIGDVDTGWTVSAATLSSERAMISGSGSGGIGRLGGVSADTLIAVARERGRWSDPLVRDAVMRVWAEEQVRAMTNARARASAAAGQSPGAAASIGKVHQAGLNQRIQSVLVDLVGIDAIAWDADRHEMPPEVRGLLRSLANSIEGGTTEVNKNVLGERVLGLPREPDPWKGRPWDEVPRS